MSRRYAQLHEVDSFLSLYRRLLRLRANTILRNGTYEAFGELEADVFNVYSRWLGDQHVYVALNFGGEASNNFLIVDECCVVLIQLIIRTLT